MVTHLMNNGDDQGSDNACYCDYHSPTSPDRRVVLSPGHLHVGDKPNDRKVGIVGVSPDTQEPSRGRPEVVDVSCDVVGVDWISALGLGFIAPAGFGRSAPVIRCGHERSQRDR